MTNSNIGKREALLPYTLFFKNFLIEHRQKEFTSKSLAVHYLLFRKQKITSLILKNTILKFMGIIGPLRRLKALDNAGGNRRYMKFRENSETLDTLEKYYIRYEPIPLNKPKKERVRHLNRGCYDFEMSFLGECKDVDTHFRELFEGEKK